MNIEDLDIYKSLINKFNQNKKKAIDGLNKVQKILDDESKETSEMLEVYRRYMAGERSLMPRLFLKQTTSLLI